MIYRRGRLTVGRLPLRYALAQVGQTEVEAVGGNLDLELVTRKVRSSDDIGQAIDTLFYRATTMDCRPCRLKAKCCPKSPQHRIPRSIYEEARGRTLACRDDPFECSRHDRKRVEMLFAHLKRILKLGRLRLRGPHPRALTRRTRQRFLQR